MNKNPQNYCRKTIRLKGYDYSTPGAYFVTICTIKKEPFFGIVKDGEMNLNDSGQIALKCWGNIEYGFPDISLDEFVFMPNHFHGIVNIHDTRKSYPDTVQKGAINAGAINPGAMNRAPTNVEKTRVKNVVGAQLIAPTIHYARKGLHQELYWRAKWK